MEYFKVYKSLIKPILKLGLPIEMLAMNYFIALFVIVLTSKLSLFVFFIVTHILLAIFVKFVDVDFSKIVITYIRNDKGELK